MALTEKRTLRGGGALELLDLRLFEDGGERGGALGSDAVFGDTASGGQNGNSERVGVSMGVDAKANTRVAAHSRLEICVSLRTAASAEAPSSPMLLSFRLCARSRAEMVRYQECQWALTHKRTLGAACT